jgi:hypothetical protein
LREDLNYKCLKYKGVRKIVESRKDEVRNSRYYITIKNMIQNFWVFRLFPSSGILENRKHDVSETGFVSVLRWRDEGTYSFGPLRKS